MSCCVTNGLSSQVNLGKFIIKGDIKESILNQPLSLGSSATFKINQEGFTVCSLLRLKRRRTGSTENTDQ